LNAARYAHQSSGVFLASASAAAHAALSQDILFLSDPNFFRLAQRKCARANALPSTHAQCVWIIGRRFETDGAWLNFSNREVIAKQVDSGDRSGGSTSRRRWAPSGAVCGRKQAGTTAGDRELKFSVLVEIGHGSAGGGQAVRKRIRRPQSKRAKLSTMRASH
jgi:hypothetical protein